MPHLSVGRPLLERHTQLLESFARLLHIVDSDRDVPKSFPGLGVATGVTLEVGVIFSAVVVRELQNTCDVNCQDRCLVEKKDAAPSREKRLFSFSSAVKFPSP